MVDIKSPQSILKELHEQTAVELETVDQLTNPFVFAQLSDANAKQSLIERIADRIVGGQNLTIGEAIAEIETELNPNKLD